MNSFTINPNLGSSPERQELGKREQRGILKGRSLGQLFSTMGDADATQSTAHQFFENEVRVPSRKKFFCGIPEKPNSPINSIFTKTISPKKIEEPKRPEQPIEIASDFVIGRKPPKKNLFGTPEKPKTVRKSLFADSQKTEELERTSVSGRTKHGAKIPQLVLITDSNDPKKALLEVQKDICYKDKVLIQKSNLTLKFIAKGDFHKAWKVEEHPSLLIKTFGLITAEVQANSIQTMMATYSKLKERQEKDGDIRVATLYNDVYKDGFYLWEYIEGNPPAFEDVKGLIKEMVRNPNKLIDDFKPANLIKMANGEVVLIDFETFSDDLEDRYVLLLRNWFKNYKEGLRAFINECDNEKLNVSPVWEKTKIKLAQQNLI